MINIKGEADKQIAGLEARIKELEAENKRLKECLSLWDMLDETDGNLKEKP